MPQQVLVARRDLVEVAVAAHQREQLREVGLLRHLDPGHWSRSYRLPAVYPAGTLALHLSRLGRDQHASTGCGGRAGRGRTVRGGRLGGERRSGGTGRQPAQRLRRRARAAAGVPQTAARDGIYYRPTSTTGDAGFFLAVPGAPRTVYGFDGSAGPHGPTDYTPIVSQGAVTGSGTAADPLKQVTTYESAAAARLTQTTTYVNGARSSACAGTCRTTTGAPRDFKAIAAADFFFDGSDRGTGIYTQGPPQFIGGTNADTGNSGGFAEVPAAPRRGRATRRSRSAAAPTRCGARSKARRRAPAPTFDDTVVGEPGRQRRRRRVGPVRHGRGAATSATATF